MDSVDLIFIYKYFKDEIGTNKFIISNIELAKNNIFVTGKFKGEKVYSIYERLYYNTNSKRNFFSTDISAIKNGFITKYHVDFSDKENKIIDTTFKFSFKYYYTDLSSDGEELLLKEVSLINDQNDEIQENLKEAKKLFAKRVFELLINYKLNSKQNYSSNFKDVFKSQNVSFTRKINIKYLIDEIKKKVIGQDEAINTIVPAVMLNQKLIEINNKDLMKTQKSNILIDGSTGVGKTLIIEELSKLVDIPIVISGITSFSAVGYKGSNLNEIIVSLISNANYNIEKAEKGIICFDEIDKLGDSSMEMRKAVAQELLTWINGTKINVGIKGEEISFDTSNITFVCLGAFGKMREEKNNRSIGFDTTSKEQTKLYDTEDYVKFGMQREFMGRFNTLVTLNDLNKNDFKDILLFSEISPLKSFIDLADIYDVEVNFDESFLDKLVDLSVKEGIGARALQRQMNKVRSKYIISIMDRNIKTINLTSDVFEENYIENKKLIKGLTLNG